MNDPITNGCRESGRIAERDVGPGYARQVSQGKVDEHEVGDRETPQDGGRRAAERVVAAHPDPGQRNGLGRPRDRDDRTAELDGHRDRQGSQTRPGHEQPEQVAVAFGPEEPGADGEVDEGDDRQECAPVADERAVEQHEPGRDQERGVREDEHRAGRPQDRTAMANLLAGGRDLVDQPEQAEDRQPERQRRCPDHAASRPAAGRSG